MTNLRLYGFNWDGADSWASNLCKRNQTNNFIQRQIKPRNKKISTYKKGGIYLSNFRDFLRSPDPNRSENLKAIIILSEGEDHEKEKKEKKERERQVRRLQRRKVGNKDKRRLMRRQRIFSLIKIEKNRDRISLKKIRAEKRNCTRVISIE